MNLTSLTLLGGHQDHTVSSTGAIDGCRSSILQHVDALDVARIQTIQTIICSTTGDSVNHEQWGTGTHGTHTTDVHLKALSRLSRCLCNVHTRSAGLHSAQSIGGVQLGDIITLHLNGSTGHQFLLLGTVTYDNHFLQDGIVILHRNLEVVLVTNLDFLSLETDERYDDRCTRLHIEREVTVKVGNSTIRGTLFHYAGSDDGTLSIDHSTCDLLRCLLDVLHVTSGIGV